MVWITNVPPKASGTQRQGLWKVTDCRADAADLLGGEAWMEKVVTGSGYLEGHRLCSLLFPDHRIISSFPPPRPFCHAFGNLKLGNYGLKT